MTPSQHFKSPKSFNEAWNHPKKDSHKKWQESICTVFADMSKQQVWWMTHKSLMPSNCKCIKSKCVFKIKHNGVYQVHLVLFWYRQVPGVDFTENYSLVINDITFCIILLMVLHFSYSAKKVDIETLFLWRPQKRNVYGVSSRHIQSKKRLLCHF